MSRLIYSIHDVLQGPFQKNSCLYMLGWILTEVAMASHKKVLPTYGALHHIFAHGTCIKSRKCKCGVRLYINIAFACGLTAMRGVLSWMHIWR